MPINRKSTETILRSPPNPPSYHAQLTRIIFLGLAYLLCAPQSDARPTSHSHGLSRLSPSFCWALNILASHRSKLRLHADSLNSFGSQTPPLASHSSISPPRLSFAQRKSLHLPRKCVVVCVADGSEEVEVAACVDILARAGSQVLTASVMNQVEVGLSRGLQVKCDVMIEEVEEMIGRSPVDKIFGIDCLVLPGGMPGAYHLKQSASLTRILSKQHQDKKL
eukprot:GHVN01041745.1.p1 GENE.GHVN01041745.1~~GHVN01041745.1.p1  ORF type:complete len:222 (+),score=53.99 GHVN01041745.1:58-723(+)